MYRNRLIQLQLIKPGKVPHADLAELGRTMLDVMKGHPSEADLIFKDMFCMLCTREWFEPPAMLVCGVHYYEALLAAQAAVIEMYRDEFIADEERGMTSKWAEEGFFPYSDFVINHAIGMGFIKDASIVHVWISASPFQFTPTPQDVTYKTFNKAVYRKLTQRFGWMLSIRGRPAWAWAIDCEVHPLDRDYIIKTARENGVDEQSILEELKPRSHSRVDLDSSAFPTYYIEWRD
jgi:hypothetical protein